MSAEVAGEFLDLIEAVAEDGELTYREIYSLGKWINENRDRRSLWPANLFLSLLKDVFADGRIETSEAQEVGRLIQTVRRQWSRLNQNTDLGVSANRVDEAMASFDASQPRFPAISVSLELASKNEFPGNFKLDFLGPSCNCSDFQTSRRQLPEGHLSRCCKHLMQGYSQLRPPAGWPSWLDSFLETGFRPAPKQRWQVLDVEGQWVLISSANRDWASAYMKIGTENAKFGYSVVEQRWSYNTAPQHENIISRAINNLSCG